MLTKWTLNDTKSKFSNFDIPIDNNILSILSKRGLEKKEDIINFINPKLENLEDPTKLKDLSIAVEYILKYINEDKKICIYGDYDVDGITSTSLLYLSLKKLNAKNICYYIPLRNEGYGLNKEALKNLKEDNVDLVITVDCGISSYEEVEFAKNIGLDMIITDHHDIPNHPLPKALAVINPKIPDSKYSFKNLAGVGVAFMLAYELFKSKNKLNEVFEFIDLVSLGTIADIMPLISENRIIVKFGLEKIKNSSNLGLKTIIELLKIDKKELTPGDISFKIAPIFNASGRLADAKLAVKLLTSDNINEVLLLAKDLIENNFHRKTIQEECVKNVLKELENIDISKEYIIISHSEEHHHGIIGIVASKVVEKYYLPTIIMEENHLENIAVGSCRSINGFNINKALSSVSKYLIKFGGHAGAAGFTISLDNIEIFKKELKKYAKKELEKIEIFKPINIDMEIPAQKISYEFLQSLNLLKPFGFGNPTPLLLTKNCIINNLSLSGSNKEHLKLDIEQKGFFTKNVFWFNNGLKINELEKTTVFYDIVFKLESSDFLGRKYLNVHIEDMKPSNLKEDKFKFFHSMYNTSFPIKSIFYTNMDVSENDDIHIKKNYVNYSVLIGGKTIGKLNENISNLLSKLNEFYNYEFIAKIESIEKFETHKAINILIKRNYELINYSPLDKIQFVNIKRFINKDFEYNSFTKEALSIYFKENKSILINENNINIYLDEEKIKINVSYFYNLLLNIAMKYYFKYNKKINFYTTNKYFINYANFKPYINFISKTTPKINEEEAIFDFNTVKNYNNIQFRKSLILYNKDYTNNKIYDIKKEIHFEKNYKKIQKNLDKINNPKFYDYIFTNFLPIKEKKRVLELAKNNKVIFCDDSIIEYI